MIGPRPMRLATFAPMLGNHPQKVDPGAFSGQRQGWKTPERTLWQCTAFVCVVGMHCWEISLGLADPL